MASRVIGRLPVVYYPQTGKLEVESAGEFVETQLFQRLDELAKDKPLRLTRRQWIPLAAFLIIALHSFTSPYWPEMPVLSALKEMDTVLFTSVALAVLALIRWTGNRSSALW